MAEGSALSLLHWLSLALLAWLLLSLSRLLRREVNTVLTGYSRREGGEDVGQD